MKNKDDKDTVNKNHLNKIIPQREKHRDLIKIFPLGLPIKFLKNVWLKYYNKIN